MKQDVINQVFPVEIKQMAIEQLKFDQNQVIDLFSALGGEQLTKPELLDDFCHPNNQGYEAIAEEISKHILVHILK